MDCHFVTYVEYKPSFGISSFENYFRFNIFKLIFSSGTEASSDESLHESCESEVNSDNSPTKDEDCDLNRFLEKGIYPLSLITLISPTAC